MERPENPPHFDVLKWLDLEKIAAYNEYMDDLVLLSQRDALGLSRESCYRALVAKDARFDGVFFTGVKTTGIYCRPICAVRTPKESSCCFFSTAAAAEAAGFRPCLRCRPELAPYALQQNLAYAVWQRIAAGALNDGDVERLSKEVGLSSRQLRRILLQHFGVTPVELAQTQRLLFAKKLLQETRMPMIEVAYAAGFGSVRRFNALFAQRYGMAPTSVRRASLPEGTMEQGALTLRLAYRPPFNWSSILAYLAVRAIPNVEMVQADALMRSVRIGQVSGWIRVTHLASRHQVELQFPPALSSVLMPLLARVRAQLDLDANPAVIEAHLQTDPLLAARIEKAPGLRVPGAFDSFELAMRAVLGQQISVPAATTLAGRLVEKYGERCETPFEKVMHHFPRAEVIAVLASADVAQLGMPLTRAQAIVNLAQFATQGGLDMRPGMTLEESVAHLRTVGGIGDWTAHYIALRALRFPDAFPAGDLGLQKAASEDSSARLTEKQLTARAASWSPWRGYAASILWMTS